MDNKIIPVILAVTVGILLTGSVLAPIISDSQMEIRTIANNETAYYVSDTNISEDLVFTCDSETDSFFVNGVKIDWTTADAGQNYRQIFVFTNAVSISFGPDHEVFTFASLDYPQIGTGGAVISLTINKDGTWSALSLDGTTTYEGITPVEWAIYPSVTGTLGCYALDFNVTEGKDALIFNGTRTITVDGTDGFLYSRTTITDGVATTDYAKTIVGGVVTDVSLDVVATGEMMNGYYHYDGGYTMSSDGFDTATPTGVIFAPIEYTYISSTDSTAIELLQVLPLLVIVALAIVAIGLTRSRF